MKIIALLVLALGLLAFLTTTSAIKYNNESNTSTISVGVDNLLQLLYQNRSVEWLLSPTHEGPEVKTGYLVIKADREWQIQVIDKNPLTSGHMREWDGTNYGNRILSSPVRISAEREVTLPDGGIIQTGNKTDYFKIPVNFKQEVGWLDEPLFGGTNDIYRIIVTFSFNQQV
jgi:hypothetical protein